MFRSTILKKSYNRKKYQIDQTGQKTRVRQSEKDSTDINKIMERFNRSGKLPAMQQKPGFFGQAISVPYDQALMIVKQAQEAFKELPSATRKFFDNDPQKLSEFVANPKNNAKAVELGLKEYLPPTTEELLTEVVKNTKPLPKETDKK